MKNLKAIFIRNLTILSSLVIMARIILSLFVDNLLVPDQLFLFIYAFTPAVSVILTEKKGLRTILAEYKVTLRGINFKGLLKYIAGTAILFPLFIVISILILGNIFDIDSFGKIGIIAGKYEWNGIGLPENQVLRALIFSLISLSGALLMGLTYNMLLALGGEIAWRGFLTDKLQGGKFGKDVITGLIWAIWYIPVVFVIGRESVSDYLYTIVLTCMFFMAMSFLLSNAVRETGSLFTSAAVGGVVMSSSLSYFMLEPANNYLAGVNGLFAILSVLVIGILLGKKHLRRIGRPVT